MQRLCDRPIEGVFSVVGKFSHLEVTTDDVCEVIARFGGGVVGSIHLDMVDRSARSEVEIIGTRTTLIVDLEGHSVRLYDHSARRWDITTFTPSYDQMYRDELEHFFACVESGKQPSPDLRDGYHVQKVIDACARSSAERRWAEVK
jgi:predicted dehydrogenase